MLQGKKGIIFGIANDHSIAWGIGKKLKENGARLGITYQNDLLLKRVQPLAEELNSAKIAGQEMLAIENHAFSIDGQNGIVTQIQTYSDEWLDDAKVRHDKQMK